MNNKIKIALLDLNNAEPNLGMGNIIQLAEDFKSQSKEPVEIEIFDVRHKNEIPDIDNHDIFISSGGPGSPLPEGLEWEEKFGHFLDSIWEHNLNFTDKKFLLLICHSFQLSVIHWKLAFVTKRKSFSFGIMPVFKTREGQSEPLFTNLDNPFYAVDSRSYQCIKPKKERLNDMGASVVAIEKFRPHVNLERAIMAIRFSPEIFGTQFHPEAESVSFLKNLEDEQNRIRMIKRFGRKKYLETLDRVDDEDKIIKTHNEIIPRFLNKSTKSIMRIRSKQESLQL